MSFTVCGSLPSPMGDLPFAAACQGIGSWSSAVSGASSPFKIDPRGSWRSAGGNVGKNLTFRERQIHPSGGVTFDPALGESVAWFHSHEPNMPRAVPYSISISV